MNIACSTLPFRSYALGEALRKIVSFGMKRVEFCVDPRHSDPNKWKERPEEIKLLIQQSGLVLNSIHVPLPEEIPSSLYDKAKEDWSLNTKRSIDLAAFFGAPFVVQHVRIVEMSTEGGQGIKSQRTLPDLPAVAQYAARRKIKVAVENAPSSTTRMLGASIGEITDFVDALPDESVGICLDLSHCLACGRDPMEALESVNIHRLLSVHASDNLSNQLRDVHLPIGEGHIPWKRVLDILESLEFRGSFVVEVAEGENGERTLGDSLKFLRGIHGFDNWH
jgi:sugar phosphate isomerase/epimerase